MREKVKDLNCGPVDSCSIWRKSSNADKNAPLLSKGEGEGKMSLVK